MRSDFLVKSFLFVLLSVFGELIILEDRFIDLAMRRFVEFDKAFLYVLMTLIVFVFWIFSVRFFYQYCVKINEEELAKDIQLAESEKLIQTLSSQRHDFRNQLQVIKALAEFNRNEEIIRYIADSSMALDLSNNMLTHINNAVLSAMFLVFSTQAKERGISFQVESDVDFENWKLSPVKVTRVLGNIIQNGIEILERHYAEERVMEVTMWETRGTYCFVIWNNGPVIPIEIQEKIFNAGFTTKNSTGLGLSIVKELTSEMGGSISLKSDQESGTEFKVILPKSLVGHSKYNEPSYNINQKLTKMIAID